MNNLPITAGQGNQTRGLSLQIQVHHPRPFRHQVTTLHCNELMKTRILYNIFLVSGRQDWDNHCEIRKNKMILLSKSLTQLLEN